MKNSGGSEGTLPTWIRKWGLGIGILVLLFLMLLILLVGSGRLDLCGTGVGSGLIVLVLALGIGLAFAFIGGSAAISGRIPMVKDSTISLTGGLAAIVVVMAFGGRVFNTSDCPGGDSGDSTAVRLLELKQGLASLNTRMMMPSKSESDLTAIREASLPLAQGVKSLPHDSLTLSQQVEQAYYASLGYLLAGMASYGLSRRMDLDVSEEFSALGDSASTLALVGLQRIRRMQTLEASRPGTYAETLSRIGRDRLVDNLFYHSAAGLALRVGADSSGGAVVELRGAFDSISPGYFMDWAPCTDEVVDDLCRQHQAVLGPQVCQPTRCRFGTLAQDPL